LTHILRYLGCLILVRLFYRTMNFWVHYKSRVISDIFLIIAAIVPASIAFYCDTHFITSDAFLRSGAIMALFAAFLEFKTHEVQALRERDNFHRLWTVIGTLTEGLANVDRAAKHSLREMANLIESAGLEPAMGKASDIKDMVISEKIKALKFLTLVPESYYSYTSFMALFGKILVVFGTLIWAFGDFLVKYVNT